MKITNFNVVNALEAIFLDVDGDIHIRDFNAEMFCICL